jgi:hypothetical protein
MLRGVAVSPVSDDGRGLKLLRDDGLQLGNVVSPVSDDGRGLKLRLDGVGGIDAKFRPSVMTGVD